MSTRNKLMQSAVASVLALGSVHAADAQDAQGGAKEKCYGIAKAGQNGCNSNVNKHSCAGHAKIDNDPMDFVKVPNGSCLKLGGKPESAASSEKK